MASASTSMAVRVEPKLAHPHLRRRGQLRRIVFERHPAQGARQQEVAPPREERGRAQSSRSSTASHLPSALATRLASTLPSCRNITIVDNKAGILAASSSVRLGGLLSSSGSRSPGRRCPRQRRPDVGHVFVSSRPEHLHPLRQLSSRHRALEFVAVLRGDVAAPIELDLSSSALAAAPCLALFPRSRRSAPAPGEDNRGGQRHEREDAGHAGGALTLRPGSGAAPGFGRCIMPLSTRTERTFATRIRAGTFRGNAAVSASFLGFRCALGLCPPRGSYRARDSRRTIAA